MGFLKMPFRLLILVIGLFVLSACSDDSSSGQPTSATSVTELPPAVLTLPDGGRLRAYISIDSDERVELSISENTASGKVPNLTRSTHDVLISFEYTDSSGNTVTVATAKQTVDLSSGDASISFAEGDYDMDFDFDKDGLTNAEELAAGTSWNDSKCVLGFSLIGSCTL